MAIHHSDTTQVYLVQLLKKKDMSPWIVVLGDIDFYEVDSSKVVTLTESATLFLAHIDGLYMVNLYRNVEKAGRLLNSADYKSFSCLYFEKM